MTLSGPDVTLFGPHVTLPVTPHLSYLTHETSSSSRSTPWFLTEAHNAMV
jgi:hypothetical protein